MEVCAEFKIVFIFIILQCGCVSTVKENDILGRLSVLENMLTEMENIVRATDFKVRKAHNKFEDTERTLERDFSRLQNSLARKVRKGYRQIMKEVKIELKYDSHLIKEMFESVKHINLKAADDQKINLNSTTGDMESMNEQFDKSLDEDKSPTRGVSESRVMFKAAKLTKQHYSNGDTIVFPEVVFNIGEGYDPTYGHFVTPLAGTYYFTVQLYIGGFKTDVGIFVDEECVAFATFTPRNESCENLAVVVTLKLGDVVYLKQASQPYNNTYPSLDSDFNTFSGVFIR